MDGDPTEPLREPPVRGVEQRDSGVVVRLGGELDLYNAADLRSALASAIALLGSLASLDAQALGLGRISVQSALGETLRAEIEILEISADEAASLKVGVASAEAFKAAGLEYTAAVVGSGQPAKTRRWSRLFAPE